MKQILKIVVVTLATMACCYSAQAQNRQNIRQDWLVFIGEVEKPELVTEGGVSQDTIDHTPPVIVALTITKNHFSTKAKIIKPLYGNCPEDEITFSFYDEFNPPVWPDEEVELCILYKDDTLKDIEGYFCNSVWNDCRLFKTKNGEYVLDYKAYYRLINKPDKKWIRCFQADCQPIDLVSGEYYQSKPRAKNYKSSNESKLSNTRSDKYYRKDGDKTYPTHGVPLDVFIKRYVRHMKLPRKGIAN